jgi:flagellar biosynthetic protein FliS
MAFLLDKVASHLDDAKRHIESNRIEQRFLSTEKALDILCGLDNVLDHNSEEVKEFVTDMSNFLRRMVIGLTEVNLKNDPQLCERMIGAIKEMANIWRLAARTSAASTVAGHTAPSAQPAPEHAPQVLSALQI